MQTAQKYCHLTNMECSFKIFFILKTFWQVRNFIESKCPTRDVNMPENKSVLQKIK